MTVENFEYDLGDLFQEGSENSDWDLVAAVGPNGGPYNYQDYAIGYFQAARRIYESLFFDPPPPVDIMVYPLTFLYRQGIELSIKDLVNFLSPEGARPKLTHKLTDNWSTLRHLIEDFYGRNRLPITLDSIEKLLNDFAQIDPNSMVFRYPEDRKGRAFLQNYETIDLSILNSHLEKVAEWFEILMEAVRENYHNQS